MHYITERTSFPQTFLTSHDVFVSLVAAHLPRSPAESVKRHSRLNLTLRNSCKAHYITTLGCFGVPLISHGAQHAVAICCSRWMRYPGNGAKSEHLSKPRFKQNNTVPAHRPKQTVLWVITFLLQQWERTERIEAKCVSAEADAY